MNGERNGKGKEYDDYNGKLIYEGEFLNDERNGKRKKYDNEGKLAFVWEFKNGKIYNTKQNSKNCIIKNGERYVKLFDKNNNLLFAGEYKNGEKMEKGKSILIID